MLKNYLKTSLRALPKNKTYSFLNIFGLAIGIACAGLIFLWVEDELHFDQFNVKERQFILCAGKFVFECTCVHARVNARRYGSRHTGRNPGYRQYLPHV